MTPTWELEVGGKVVGTLRVRGPDQPFFLCDFEPSPEFESVRSLFAEELRLLNGDQMDAWNEAYERILSRGLRLRSVETGEVLDELLLHIDGHEAWFRC